MFIVIINFPPIKTGKDAEFREWFVQTNKDFANHKGFISRRLLNPSRVATMLPSWSMRAMKPSWPCIIAPLTPKPASWSDQCLTAAELLNFMR